MYAKAAIKEKTIQSFKKKIKIYSPTLLHTILIYWIASDAILFWNKMLGFLISIAIPYALSRSLCLQMLQLLQNIKHF